MKKLVLMIIALVATVSTMFAGNKVNVVSGNVNAIQGKNVYVDFDYSKMMILDEDTKKTMTEAQFCQMKGEDWVRDMGKDTQEAEAYFKQQLQKKAKGFNVVSDKADADYVLTCQPTTFSYGNPYAFQAFMSNDVKGFFVGKFIVADKSGNNVAKLDCMKVTGKGGWSWTIQKNKVYIEVANNVAKTLNK